MDTVGTTQNKFTDEQMRGDIECGADQAIKAVSHFAPEVRLAVLEAALNKAASQSVEDPLAEQSKGWGTQVEDMVEAWLMKQAYYTKLAILIWDGYFDSDHGTDKAICRIRKKFEAEILEMVKNPDDSFSKKDAIMLGIAAELFVWGEHQ